MAAGCNRGMSGPVAKGCGLGGIAARALHGADHGTGGFPRRTRRADGQAMLQSNTIFSHGTYGFASRRKSRCVTDRRHFRLISSGARGRLAARGGGRPSRPSSESPWIPAFAGMTVERFLRLPLLLPRRRIGPLPFAQRWGGLGRGRFWGSPPYRSAAAPPAPLKAAAAPAPGPAARTRPPGGCPPPARSSPARADRAPAPGSA